MVDHDGSAEDVGTRSGTATTKLGEQGEDAAEAERNRDGSLGATVPVLILGKRYDVPEGSTIQSAFEFAGYRLTRGCGCRGGFCGACATVFRVASDYRLKVGLACQTVVQPEMSISTVPFFPAQKALYDLRRVSDPARTAIDLYPELTRCYGCATCNKACPQNLDVLGYIAAMLRGDLERAAEISFECVMCGLCAARCPAEIAPYNAALFARRAYASLIRPRSRPLQERVAEIAAGKFDGEIAELTRMDTEALKQLHAKQDMEIP